MQKLKTRSKEEPKNLKFLNIEISDIIRVNDSQFFDSILHLKSSALIFVLSEQIKMIDRKSPRTVIIFLHLLKTQLHLNSLITQISRQKFLANKIRLSYFSHHDEIDTKV